MGLFQLKGRMLYKVMSYSCALVRTKTIHLFDGVTDKRSLSVFTVTMLESWMVYRTPSHSYKLSGSVTSFLERVKDPSYKPAEPDWNLCHSYGGFIICPGCDSMLHGRHVHRNAPWTTRLYHDG